MQQKDVFLQSEADAWYQRNRLTVSKRDFAVDDPVTSAILEISVQPEYAHKKIRILEVGCGEGRRLSWLAANLDSEVHGVEPSLMAVEQASLRGAQVIRGTADKLPFGDATFDVVVYGFCLYLCDRQDLFQIAKEADRVLKAEAWVVINDFFASTPVRREYHHRPGIFSYKMDYRKLFDWHPSYTCFAHKVGPHGQTGFTDETGEWVATSILRKKIQANE